MSAKVTTTYSDSGNVSFTERRGKLTNLTTWTSNRPGTTVRIVRRGNFVNGFGTGRKP